MILQIKSLPEIKYALTEIKGNIKYKCILFQLAKEKIPIYLVWVEVLK